MASISVAKQDRNLEALGRARSRMPSKNDQLAIMAFSARGIALDDIETIGPNQNVFTYPAWQALGRQVRKGERGVKLAVFGETVRENKETGKRETVRFRRAASVFHVSQTDARQGGDA